jgi:hypothetical protein
VNCQDASPHPYSQGHLTVTVQFYIYIYTPFTVTARSKARTFFNRSNAGTVGSNPTQGMDVCLRLLCVCVILCVGRVLATG